MRRALPLLLVLFLLGCGSPTTPNEPVRWDSARWNQAVWQ